MRKMGKGGFSLIEVVGMLGVSTISLLGTMRLTELSRDGSNRLRDVSQSAIVFNNIDQALRNNAIFALPP